MLPVDFEEATILRGPFVAGFSDDDFFRFCQENELMRVERTANHEIILMPPAGFESSAASGDACYQIMAWSRGHGGRTLESSAGYSLPDGSVLSPDVSWISAEAWAALTPPQRQKFPPICPSFIIEVKSPSDRIKTLKAKMEQWLANGVQLGFLLDIEAKIAYIYRPGESVKQVDNFDSYLSGEPVLPGFRLDLRELRQA